MYTLSTSISQSPSSSSLIPRKTPFSNPRPVTVAFAKRMDNHEDAVKSTPGDAAQPEPLVGRRDLLALGVAAASACASASSDPPAAIAAAEYPIKLDGVVSRVVARPRKSRSKAEKEEEEEVLVIEGIEFDRGYPVKFDVYVNDDDVGDSPRGGPDTAEFAGTMVNVPHGQGRGKSNIMKTCLRLGISDLLENVGADDDDSIIVTLVPKSGIGMVTIGNIAIQLLS